MTAALVLGLVSVLGVGAVQNVPEVRIDPRALAPRPRSGAGFERPLFKLPAPVLQIAGMPAPAQPRVVCGMTVISADPGVDPKMPIQVPREDTEFTIRTVTPSLCRD